MLGDMRFKVKIRQGRKGGKAGAEDGFPGAGEGLTCFSILQDSVLHEI